MFEIFLGVVVKCPYFSFGKPVTKARHRIEMQINFCFLYVADVMRV